MWLFDSRVSIADTTDHIVLGGSEKDRDLKDDGNVIQFDLNEGETYLGMLNGFKALDMAYPNQVPEEILGRWQPIGTYIRRNFEFC